MAGFIPKEAGGIENPGANMGDAPGSDGSNEPYTFAPATSHLYAFKYQDIRKPQYSFLRKFGTVFSAKLGENVSILTVIFRNNKGGSGARYAYGFSDHDLGQEIFNALASSAHPYSEVLLPRVRLAGIPYTRT